MSLLKQTIKAITLAIENETEIDVVNNDITENEPRPCFYIEPTQIVSDYDGIQIEHETQEIRIVYFDKNTYEGYLNLLDMKETLQGVLLGLIPTDSGTNIQINQIEWNVYRGDMVLTADVSVEIFGKDVAEETEEEIENMENLLENL